MSGSDRVALPYVWQLLGGPPECPGVVVRPSRMFGSGPELLLEVREWSRYHPGRPGVVERPSRMSGSGPESLPEIR